MSAASEQIMSRRDEWNESCLKDFAVSLLPTAFLVLLVSNRLAGGVQVLRYTSFHPKWRGMIRQGDFINFERSGAN